MKILLIGHSIIDHLEEGGKDLVKPGGIFYSTMGIVSNRPQRENICLLTGWNRESFGLFEKLYSKTDMTYSVEIDKMPEVFLNTAGEGEREETYLNLSNQLSLRKVYDWNIFDGILINMITGFDITLDQLKMIRDNFRGVIYLDIHTLSRGTGKNMKREFRPIPEIDRWLANIDILQCNESELKTIVANGDELECASEIINKGVKEVIVTKGEKGASLYYIKNSAVSSYSAAGEKIITLNKVGCGDIFGAVFFYSYISTGDLYKSLLKANHAGSVAASVLNLNIEVLLNI